MKCKTTCKEPTLQRQIRLMKTIAGRYYLFSQTSHYNQPLLHAATCYEICFLSVQKRLLNGFQDKPFVEAFYRFMILIPRIEENYTFEKF